jgi:SH3 domain protein
MRFTKRLSTKFLAVLLVVMLVLPLVFFNDGFNTSAATTTATVSASSLNVRSGPGTNYSVIASVTKGTAVTVLDVGSNGWNQIQMPNGKTGYVSATYLTISSSPADTTTTAIVVNATLLNVRSGPGTSYSVKAGIAGGTQVNVISTANGWSRVILPNGTEGYVSSSYLSETVGSKPTVPAVPTGVTISSITPTSATINWNAVSGATEYQVSVIGDWRSTTATSYTYSNLKANTTYDYCVRSRNAVGYSAWGAYSTFTTTSTSANPTATVKPATLPAVPTGLRSTAITSNSITLNWNAVSDATEYQVNVSGGWITVTGTSNTVHTRTGLKADTSYDYCIRSKNAVGYSAWSAYGHFKTDSASTTTTTPATIPAIPTNVNASAIGSNSVTINWNSVSTATEYQVNVSGGWTTVSGVNTTSHTRTGLKENTSYDYCVRARNAVGYSAWSAYGYFKTASTSASTPTPSTPSPTPVPTPSPVVTAKPAVPTNVKATVSENTVTITWSPVSGAASYIVNLIGDHRTTEATTYTYTNLVKGVKYDYCVKAVNSYGESTWSVSGEFTLGEESYGGNPTPTPIPSTPAPGGTGGSFAAATKLNASATSATAYNGNLATTTQNDYFEYTAAVAGIHLIKSSGNVNVVGELFDSDKGSIVSDNDDKGDGKNFVMGYKFKAGKKFYIKVKGNATGAYTLTVAPPKPPKAVLLYTGSYTDTAKYPEFTTSDVNALLGKDSGGLNTKEFIITDGGVGYNHYMENGQKKEVITLASINAMTTAHTSAVSQIKPEYVTLYNDRFKNAQLSLNDFVNDSISLANKLIQADSEVQIWFTFPNMHFISLAQNYVEPYRAQVFEAIKSKMSIKDWNRNVRGFYMGTESIVQWYTSFNKTNTTANISNDFGNSVVTAMRGLSDTVRGAGKEMIWIPYYGYPDTEDAIRVGWVANKTDIFDYIVIQPNTYFADEVYAKKGTLTFGAANMGLVSLSVKNKQVYDRNTVVIGGGRTSNTKIGMEMEIDQYIMYDVSALQSDWLSSDYWSIGSTGSYPRKYYWTDDKDNNGNIILDGYRKFVNSKREWYYQYETANNGNKTTVPVVYYAGAKDSLLRANHSGTKEVAEVIKNFFNYNLW